MDPVYPCYEAWYHSSREMPEWAEEETLGQVSENHINPHL